MKNESNHHPRKHDRYTTYVPIGACPLITSPPPTLANPNPESLLIPDACIRIHLETPSLSLFAHVSSPKQPPSRVHLHTCRMDVRPHHTVSTTFGASEFRAVEKEMARLNRLERAAAARRGAAGDEWDRGEEDENGEADGGSPGSTTEGAGMRESKEDQNQEKKLLMIDEEEEE
eukprot:CAMPEP_0167823422 /NCGR_PEP_ID=MMETSP0112_2-20121227/8094_1 /TAXON_ID=91324 /ORGANISM="Lotharella globosa, Strain CCCM811" /LENGTH=173 /DNA_ID=CAMNT_0007725001 /DNA_START=359 /DNA_END=880 /DNA_ORIENTATION=-